LGEILAYILAMMNVIAVNALHLYKRFECF